jgi:hypothetical protein
MKKFILISVFFSMWYQVKSQIVQDTLPWCPPGASWLYKSSSPSSSMYFQFNYVKDTLLKNIIVKKLNVEAIQIIGPNRTEFARYSQIINAEFLFKANNSIYWFDKISKDFKFIYSFNPQLNDEFIVGNSRAKCYSYSNFLKTDTIKVTKLYKDTFDNLIFDIINTDYNKKFKLGTIVKNIGSISSPFPQINPEFCNNFQTECGIFYEGLICYSDSLRGTLTFYSLAKEECHFAKTAVNNLTKMEGNLNVKLYPNPASTKLIITSETTIKEIYIYDLVGKLVKQMNKENTKTKETEITIDELNTGIYFIQLVDVFDSKWSSKFIKE